ncbi:uncharacterized protein STEHIDRAFT_113162 [Stereum hirsutum FP-91666 SS1]|uniref:uncharacterized protein n=1 Tax=Stereum hirsutum (strain FP-91666) TaxID=721885 RepID=UPI0004449EBD|nr:uncharacterized protein STEHIDRAFT_113162 [Stereum hirsutum FP-91666 SS1]EIM83931.1 hypothetical protein STEHIDRAFT_113162 [Stereum hirsutum FP-91666 SS1]
MTVLRSREFLSPADGQLGQAVGYFILFDSLDLALESMLYALWFRVLKLRTALWALDLAVLNISIRSYFIDDIELPFSERVSRGRRIIALFSRVQDVIYSFEVRTLSLFKIGYSRGLTSYSFPLKFGLGDCIVVWRACVLTRDLPKLWAVLIALLIGSFASSLGFVGCIIHEGFPAELATICTDIEIAAISFSILTNIAATGSIGYIAWNRIEKILWSIVESGVIYVFVWTTQLSYFVPVTFPVGSAGNFLPVLLTTLGQQVVGIYPTIVIIIVDNGVSALDSVAISRNAPVSSLQFASNSWTGQGPMTINQDSDDLEDGGDGRHRIHENEEEAIEGKDLSHEGEIGAKTRRCETSWKLEVARHTSLCLASLQNTFIILRRLLAALNTYCVPLLKCWGGHERLGLRQTWNLEPLPAPFEAESELSELLRSLGHSLWPIYSEVLQKKNTPEDTSNKPGMTLLGTEDSDSIRASPSNPRYTATNESSHRDLHRLLIAASDSDEEHLVGRAPNLSRSEYRFVFKSSKKRTESHIVIVAKTRRL